MMPIDDSERSRRRKLLHAHYAAENNHDLAGIMATFSKQAEMQYNRQSFPTDETIRWAHAYIGMTEAPGAFSSLRAIIDYEHFTDEETVVEGRLLGKHSSEFLGFAPTDRDIELPFVAFYRFDAEGKLTSERVVMNLGPLHA
jgi:hypothetical protein